LFLGIVVRAVRRDRIASDAVLLGHDLCEGCVSLESIADKHAISDFGKPQARAVSFAEAGYPFKMERTS
jgi:hypothetical protein